VLVGSLIWVAVGTASNFTVIRHRIISRRFWKRVAQALLPAKRIRDKSSRP
jgi:hypothetical protein